MASKLTSSTHSPAFSSSRLSKYARHFSTSSNTSCRFSFPACTPSINFLILVRSPPHHFSRMADHPDRRRQLVRSDSTFFFLQPVALAMASFWEGVGKGLERLVRKKVRMGSTAGGASGAECRVWLQVFWTSGLTLLLAADVFHLRLRHGKFAAETLVFGSEPRILLIEVPPL